MQSDDLIRKAHEWIDELKSQKLEKKKEIIQFPIQYAMCCSYAPNANVCGVPANIEIKE